MVFQSHSIEWSVSQQPPRRWHRVSDFRVPPLYNGCQFFRPTSVRAVIIIIIIIIVGTVLVGDLPTIHDDEAKTSEGNDKGLADLSALILRGCMVKEAEPPLACT